MDIRRLQSGNLKTTVTVSDTENKEGWDQVDPPFSIAWLECSTIVNTLTYHNGDIEVSNMDESTISALGLNFDLMIDPTLPFADLIVTILDERARITFIQ